jgi:hypothetical protein
MKRLVAILLVLTLYGLLSAQNSADSIVFQNFIRYAAKEKLEKKPAGERVAAVGRFFLGTPYVAYTLEAPGPERLQVNLHGLDCTTLVENALTLSRLLVSGKNDFDTYKSVLTAIRYRNGKLDGYPSRLHYASDWLVDNVKKGFVTDIPACVGMDTLHPKVNYMTTHPNAYAALKADSMQLPVIAAQEARINQLTFLYLPKSNVTEKTPCIHNGDILAISTTFPGLDFAHLGIAVRHKGKVYLLHASSTGKKVLLSETPLSVYLAGIKKHSGIVVVRPL